MTFSKTVRIILAAILTTLTFLQLELNIGHVYHVIIAAIIVFLAALGVNKENG